MIRTKLEASIEISFFSKIDQGKRIKANKYIIKIQTRNSSELFKSAASISRYLFNPNPLPRFLLRT